MSTNTILILLAAQRARAEEGILQRLREAGATSPTSAVAVAVEPRDAAAGDALQRLRKRRVVMEGHSPGRFYLNEDAIAAEEQSRQRTSRALLFAVLAALALVAVVTAAVALIR